MKAGITGHQKIGSLKTIKWISNKIIEIINNYKINIGYTSLAIGSDQLFAKILLENNLPYIAIIPCKQYEKTFFKKKFILEYRYLINNAFKTIKLNYIEPEEIAFYEAGKKVVDLSEIIIAVWDGNKSKGLGGTADIVKYAISKNKNLIHINPITKDVLKF